MPKAREVQPGKTSQISGNNKIQEGAVGYAQATTTTNAINNSIQYTRKTSQWLLDCRDTDTMTNDKNEFVTTSEPSKTMIQSATGNLS